MPITYARYVHRKPEPDAIPATFEELEDDTILLLDPVAEATRIGVGDLYRKLDHGLKASEVVVFRGADLGFVQALENDPLLPDNLTGKRVMALVGDAGPDRGRKPALLPLAGFPAPDRLPDIDKLREAELTAILQRTQAIFASNEYHYELPSGWHAEKFVRLADGLRSVYDVRRMTDWLIPHLAAHTVVIADTGSMLPLLIDLREQARLRLSWEVEISTLDRYPQDAITVSDAIAAVRNRPMVFTAQAAETDLKYLFLISVNSSGRLCRLFRTLGPQGSKIVVICQTSDEPTECDHALVHVPVIRWEVTPEGTCARCRDIPVIRVHHESYELLPSIKREPILVSKSIAEAKADFWTIADEADAVQLHVNVPYIEGGQQDFRHFSVFLDTEKLAAHPRFRQVCLRELKKVTTPDLVLIPEHNTSEVVVKLCQEAHPTADVRLIPPGRFSSELQQRLKGLQRLLVADDAIVTGFTLLNLRTELFRVTQQNGDTPEVNVFVIVSRPANGPVQLKRHRGHTRWGKVCSRFSSNLLESIGLRRKTAVGPTAKLSPRGSPLPNNGPLLAIRRRYLGRNVRQILSGVELLLPEGRHCPWCAELRLLTSFRQSLKGSALERAEERIRKLEARIEPPLLMVPSGDARGDLRTLDSFFGTLRQEAAFAAGVCAAQTLIQQLGTLGGGIQLKVIDLAMAIDAYYEGVLLASLLRTFSGVHIRYPGSDPLIEVTLRRIDPVRAYPGVVAELALAAIENKIPSRALREIVEQRKASDPWLMMMADLMDLMGQK